MRAGRRRGRAPTAGLVLAAALLLPAPALGQGPAPADGPRLTAREAMAAAERAQEVREVRREHRGVTRQAFRAEDGRWQVGYFAPGGEEVAQVLVDDATGRVQEAWTGIQVEWTMARGYPGAFGRAVNAPYVWIPLCLLFLVPFVDRRRLLSWRHLDLLALLSLSASLYFFNRARIGLSVHLAYPPLLYLLARMLALGHGARRGGRPEPLRLLVPVSWLAVAAVFLLGFRVALNVTDSNVIDVGYASVVGADRLASGEPLYGHFPDDVDHGDTYGPVAYAAYVPFEQALPWSGDWDDLPAAHLAAVAFDLLTVAGLFLLGRRLRGPPLGVVLAYAWVAFPFTLFVLNSNSNDSLVAALVVGILLVTASPAGRGALVGLAGLTKFAPLALVPLLSRWRPRGLLPFGLALAAAVGAGLLPLLTGGDGVDDLVRRTVEFQRDRGSPFSVWGYHDGLEAARTATQVGIVALGLAVAVTARRARDPVALAALAGALLIAVQLGAPHWFYLYVVWFLPAVLVAVLAGPAPGIRPPGAPGAGPARSSRPAAAATPG